MASLPFSDTLTTNVQRVHRRSYRFISVLGLRKPKSQHHLSERALKLILVKLIAVGTLPSYLSQAVRFEYLMIHGIKEEGGEEHSSIPFQVLSW